MQNLFAATLAAATWFGLGLQLLLSVQLSLARQDGVLHGVWMYFAFFTILTNLLAALTLTVPLVAPRTALARWFARAGVISGVAVYICVVGIVYNVLLRGLWHPHGWQLVADVMLHDFVPLAFLAYWWLRVPRGALHWRQLGWWCAYPVAYFLYAMARGELTRFYPYPFLDVPHLGYARVLGNAAGMLAGFLLLGALAVALKRGAAPVRA